ncbi:Hsp20/alpha crystallin family protein [Cardinium endosymbiont of Dermatophagoides farinae]|uniref:Hsp20/alpha crystallin family protein n=1 Tax=Cardinium endosymbiont of Dermatophagoides farinae TaxID=2597823 RepID=UPI001CB94CB1|nr:Hsp20/alpha crystallin family protein [Cardinium endosymbiont of Dermatophagoides farinae]
MMDNIFDNFYSLFPDLFTTKDRNLVPSIDVSETNTGYQIDAELPGIELKDIDVQVDGNLLTIKGKKEENIENKEKNYFMQERHIGSFQRSISLPNNAAIEQINAKLKDGILQLTIPKKKEAITKRIEIKS